MIKFYRFKFYFLILILISSTIVINVQEVLAKPNDNPPISIKSNLRDLKIGYCYMVGDDIEISESTAGALETGKEVNLSVIWNANKSISSQIYLVRDVNIEVTSGNLEIEKVEGKFFGKEDNHYISFKIKKASTGKPSTIKLSGVGVKFDRDVNPDSDVHFLIAWGDAISENYNPYDESPDLNINDSVYIPYATIVTSPNDLESRKLVVLSDNTITVDGISKKTDVPMYYSKENETIMLPVRSTLSAIGVSDNDIVWDDVNKSLLILTSTSTFQVSANEEIFFLKGQQLTMYNDNELPIKPEIINDRLYLPFSVIGAIIGEAFPYKDNSTIIYNGGKISPDANIKYKRLLPEDAKKQLDTDPKIILVDARTQVEHDAFYIDRKGSIVIPDTQVTELSAKMLPDKDAKIFIYCRSGRRSSIETKNLLELGYTNVYDIGGIIDWPYKTVKITTGE